MSDFDFTLQGPEPYITDSKLGELAKLVDNWVIDTYDIDTMTNGILAFDDDKRLLGIRIEAHGRVGESVNATTTGWDDVATWVKGLGGTYLFTFTRRSVAFGHGIEASNTDRGMNALAHELSDESDLVHQGHLIINGDAHRLLRSVHGGVSEEVGSMSTLLGSMDANARGAIGRSLRDNLAAHGADQEILDAMDMAIAFYEEDQHPTPEQLARLLQAIDKIQDVLNGKGGSIRALEPTQTEDQRPEVPRAFYN